MCTFTEMCCAAYRGEHLFPDSKVYGANVGSTWGRQDPGGSHFSHTNFAMWVTFIQARCLINHQFRHGRIRQGKVFNKMAKTIVLSSSLFCNHGLLRSFSTLKILIIFFIKSKWLQMKWYIKYLYWMIWFTLLLIFSICCQWYDLPSFYLQYL